MKEAILISIKQQWWDLIKKGKKKIELRKSMPKQITGSITCYVYVPEEKVIVGQFLLAAVALVQQDFKAEKRIKEEQ